MSRLTATTTSFPGFSPTHTVGRVGENEKTALILYALKQENVCQCTTYLPEYAWNQD